MSKLSLGIIGLPNVGKSTLFNALTKNNVLTANYPFATIEPNIGVVAVPDERLIKLAEMYQPLSVIPATVNFVDIAGLVANAHKGEGLGNKFLAHIREASAIVEVVRAFSDSNVTHVHNKIDPKNDIETINTELRLADIETINNRLERLRNLAKSDPTKKQEIVQLENLRGRLNNNEQIDDEVLTKIDLSDLFLLSAKPVIYVFNIDETALKDKFRQTALKQMVAPSPALFICAKVEAELADLSDQDKVELLAETGQTEPGLNQLIKVGYELLNLQSYFTAGPKEVRAWTIAKGAKAPQAAGVIHTDFERGFIAAQVVSFNDLISAGSEPAARAAGKIRTEGKDYIVKDGDVIEFRFNV